MHSKVHKYIHGAAYGFILWPDSEDLHHANVAQQAEMRTGVRPSSAGFCGITNGKVRCWGESGSTGLSAAPGDAKALAEQLGLEAA